MAWHKSYKWILIPHTAYERRRELRVRECRQTAIAWDKKYFDIDTGKFDSNKMQTIFSQSLADICLPETAFDYEYVGIKDWKRRYRDEEQRWFQPKDNDFDDQCREEENKKYHEQIIKEQQRESLRLKQEYIEQLIKEEELRLKKEKQRLYEKQKEIERINAWENELRLRTCQSTRQLPPMSNIRPNCWKPK